MHHEFRATYHAARGVLEWWHSDGRKGSDPVKPGLADFDALESAEGLYDRLGEKAQFFYFQIED